MTGRWRSAKALRAPNVVCLPTAAARQVQQPHNKWGREARAALREQQRRVFPFKLPGVRRAEKRAEVLIEVEKTAAMILAHAILAELPEETRLKIVGRLGAGVVGRAAARQAFEVANSTVLNFADRWDLMNALEAERDR